MMCFMGSRWYAGCKLPLLRPSFSKQIITTREAVLHNIFLYLQNFYKALDRDRCLEILAGYGMRLRALRLLRTYWG